MSPATIRSWITKGTLRAMRAGRRKWLVRRLELDRMLAWRSIRRRPSSPRWRMSRSSCMRSSTRCSKGRSPVAATDRGDREWRRRGAWGGGNRAMRSSAECFVDCCLTSWTSADRGHEIGLAERCEAGIDEGLDVAGQGGNHRLVPGDLRWGGARWRRGIMLGGSSVRAGESGFRCCVAKARCSSRLAKACACSAYC